MIQSVVTSFFRSIFFQKKVRACYYSDPLFRFLDQKLRISYFWKSPYRLCRQVFSWQKELGIYGETPLLLYEQMIDAFGLRSENIWIELGCGRGRGCLFLAHFLPFQVLGIDKVAYFVSQGNLFVQKHKIKNLQFICEDVRNFPTHQKAVLYVYGLTWPEHLHQKILHRFLKMPKGSKLISVGTRFQNPELSIKSIQGTFDWGKADLFLHQL